MPNNKFEVVNIVSSRKCQMIDLTAQVCEIVKKSRIESGICCVFSMHTTAGITINENADPDVTQDICMALEKVVKDDLQYKHSEGNSPAHVKTSLVGTSINVVINGGKMLLGAWQGIYFCEFDGPRDRKVVIQIVG